MKPLLDAACAQDATMPAGSAEIQKATIYNVKTFFGWVARSEDVTTALRAAISRAP